MFTIGISLIILMLVGIIVLSTFIISVFIAVRKDKTRNKPLKISYVLIGLLVLHWIFYLVSGYALLPTNIANAVFIPIWLALCVIGTIITIYEFKNNGVFAISVASFTIISLLLWIFSYGISKM